MICKVPSSNVTSFTFNARAIIDDNGTVTYVNINVDYLVETQQGENASYSTITFDLAETKPEGKFELGVSLGPILSILSTSLWWIFQGIVVGLPLCFVSLGVVILISRGLVPLWKSMLKKNKIMLPKLAIHKSVNKWKLFVVAATFVQVIAFCLPWLSRRYLYFFWEPFPIISEPTAPKELWLWSFMAVVNTVVGESKVLIFGDYWFNNRMENVNWLFLLMFQVFTIAVGLIAVKRSVSKKWAYSILLSLLSLGAPILCVYQRNAQLNFFYIKSEFFLGFWIALVSSVLYIVSVWLGKNKTKT